MTDLGLIETMRARGGRLPWLARHMARLHASAAALNLPPPPADIVDLIRIAAAGRDRVVRIELRSGLVEVSTREVSEPTPVMLVVSEEKHRPYRHKTTDRAVFGRALANARRAGAHDAVLVNSDDHVTEGTTWSLFWWKDGRLFTPAEELGILPGVGRSRVMELAQVQEERVLPAELAGRSLFLVNAVRGVVEISRFEGEPVPRDPRTAELSASFWPD